MPYEHQVRSLNYMHTSVDNYEYNSCRITNSNALEAFMRIVERTNPSLSTLKVMLEEMRDVYPQLPRDPRTLLGTPRCSPIRHVTGGSYVHIGIRNVLRKIFCMNSDDIPNTIQIQIHIDGFSRFKSSKLQFWSILGRLLLPVSGVFLIGIYCGKSKPTIIEEYLRDLIDEIQTLSSEGFTINDPNRRYTLQLVTIIADAPARSLIKQCKPHSGYHSCERCTIEGK